MMPHKLKQIDTANWQAVDKAPAVWMKITDAGETADEWIAFFQRPKLKPQVPSDIVPLLEVARGAMIYGWFYYPLLTLGAEQTWRVMDLGVCIRCQQLGIKTKRTNKSQNREFDTSFSENIDALFARGPILKLAKNRWDSIRELGNSTSHPKRLMILDPGQAQVILETAVELLNDLFQ